VKVPEWFEKWFEQNKDIDMDYANWIRLVGVAWRAYQKGKYDARYGRNNKIDPEFKRAVHRTKVRK